MLTTRVGLKVIRLRNVRHTRASLMPRQEIHPKIVREKLGHTSIQITLDTYPHVAPGLKETAAESFDKLVSPKYNDILENELIEKHD
jgi:integrase